MKKAASPKGYTPTNDADNPLYLFSSTPTVLLAAALDGRVDLVDYARREMAARGLDQQGRWVGFAKAAKLHGLAQ